MSTVGPTPASAPEATPAPRAVQGSTRGPLGRVLRSPLILPAVAILAILALGEWLSPGFASWRQIQNQLTAAAILGIVAAGQNLVILGGREGIDLSVGAVLSLGALVAGNLMNGLDAQMPVALAAALATGFLIGAFNGAGVTLLRIPPLVMTLGTAGVIQGLLVLLTSGVPSGRAAPMLVSLVTAPLLPGVPGILLVWAALALLVMAVLRYTTYGLGLYAIGVNETAAVLAGVPARLTRIATYGLSGMAAAFAGFMLLGYTGTVFVAVGDQYVLSSVIAVVIGGTALAGGTGGYAGTLLGCITLTLLQSVLIPLDVAAHGRQIIFGLTLLAFMLLYGREPRLRL